MKDLQEVELQRKKEQLEHITWKKWDEIQFKEDVEKIISQCPEKRQTLLYSATISSDIAKITERYMKDPVEVSAASQVDPAKLKQTYYDIQDNLKYFFIKAFIRTWKI